MWHSWYTTTLSPLSSSLKNIIYFTCTYEYQNEVQKYNQPSSYLQFSVPMLCYPTSSVLPAFPKPYASFLDADLVEFSSQLMSAQEPWSSFVFWIHQSRVHLREPTQRISTYIIFSSHNQKYILHYNYGFFYKMYNKHLLTPSSSFNITIKSWKLLSFSLNNVSLTNLQVIEVGELKTGFFKAVQDSDS